MNKKVAPETELNDSTMKKSEKIQTNKRKMEENSQSFPKQYTLANLPKLDGRPFNPCRYSARCRSTTMFEAVFILQVTHSYYETRKYSS